MNYPYLHLILNHLPVLGTLFGLLVLLLAQWRKSAPLQRVSLEIFVLTAVLTLPTYLTGEPTEEALKSMPGISTSVIENHQDAALISSITIGLLGALALFGLWRSRREPELPRWVLLSVLLLALVGSGLMGWTAHLGGEIRHTEIRSGPFGSPITQPTP